MGPLRFVPACGVTGATIGPATAPTPAEVAPDCAPPLSTPVQADCQLSWCRSPNASPLPLVRWLLATSTLTGPAALVPTWGLTGATTGPATAAAPPAALDWAVPSPSQVNAPFALSWSIGPLPPFWLSCALLETFASSGPVTFVPTWGLTGATTGPATAAAPPAALDWAPRLSTPAQDEFQLSW